MSFIHLTTFIKAPIDRVFDLARSIDLHKSSMKQLQEVPVDGKITGLIGLDETVTWKARHLFKTRTLKSKIIVCNRPHLFIDEQVTGDFRSLKHEHHFKECDNGTIMIDQFKFEVPYGVFGRWVKILYLENYLKRLLEARNQQVKEIAESNKWKHYLHEQQ